MEGRGPRGAGRREVAESERNSEERTAAVAALAERAYAAYSAERYEEALALGDQALAEDAGYIRAYAIKALAFCELGRAREGLAAAQEALRLDANSGLIFGVLGVCYHRLHDDDNAVPNFERALALAPDDARTYYNFACFWAEVGNASECRVALEAALKLSPARAARARHDASFARVAHEEWFRDLVAAYLSRAFKEVQP